jgi:hypothetical protein
VKRRIEQGVWLLAAALLQSSALMVPARSWASESGVAVPTDTEALQTKSDRIAHEVATLRGLPLLHPVERRVEDRAGLRHRLEEMTREEVAPNLLEAADRLLHRLRLLRPEQHYQQVMLKLLGDEIAGFYDPRAKTFFILSDMPESAQVGIMSHELHHALQDQHFGIEQMRGYGDRVQDVGLATSALLEGDALATMLMYPSGELSASPLLLDKLMSASMQAAAAPAGLSETIWQSLLFPYAGGLTFVTAVADAKGWEGVTELYAAPPQSTEQVLHPERYLERDEPTWLEHPSPLPGAERYAVDVMGEWMVRSLLGEWLGASVAPASVSRAAAGWDGDRLSGWRFAGSDRELVTWLLVWDSEEDAEAFARLGPLLATWWTGGAPASSEGAHGGAVTAGGSCSAFRLERWGDLTAVVLDEGCGIAPEARAEELARASEVMLCGTERLRYPAAPNVP